MSAITSIRTPERRVSSLRALSWFRPTLLDCLFVTLLLWLIAYTATGGSSGLLQDAGTGYHVRVGDYILRRHTVPRWDVLSFTRAGKPWYAWEWLSGVLFSVLHQMAGLKGIILFSATLIAATIAVLVRHMIRCGANALVALFLIHIGIAVSSLHFLARPHLFTLFFMAVSLYLIDADRSAPSWRIYLLLPLMVLWVNLHGGFIALPISLACLAGGDLLKSWTAHEARFDSAKRYALLAAGCLLASGVNPYGFMEHVKILEFVNAGWMRDLVLEFQGPRFEGLQGFYSELLVAGSIIVALRLAMRREFGYALLVAFWLHAGLHSVRHLPVLAIVVLPLAGSEIQQLWNRAARGTLAAIADDHTPGLARLSIWPAVAVTLIALTSYLPFPSDFPEPRFPVSLVSKYSTMLTLSQVFATDSAGDYLTYRLFPQGRVFIDGRFDVSGPKLTYEYLTVLNGARGWDRIMERYGVNAALVPADCALSSLLRGRPGWITVADGPDFALFRHELVPDVSLSPATRSANQTSVQ